MKTFLGYIVVGPNGPAVGARRYKVWSTEREARSSAPATSVVRMPLCEFKAPFELVPDSLREGIWPDTDFYRHRNLVGKPWYQFQVVNKIAKVYAEVDEPDA